MHSLFTNVSPCVSAIHQEAFKQLDHPSPAPLSPLPSPLSLSLSCLDCTECKDGLGRGEERERERERIGRVRGRPPWGRKGKERERGGGERGEGKGEGPVGRYGEPLQRSHMHPAALGDHPHRRACKSGGRTAKPNCNTRQPETPKLRLAAQRQPK